MLFVAIYYLTIISFGSSDSSFKIGIEIETTVPTPSVLAISNVPECSFTISSATASPMPEPLCVWFAL